MHDFEVINHNTPFVFAKKKNEGIATFSNMPIIYHKDFDINEFIGEELASVRGVRSVHYFPVLFDSIENSMKISNYFDKCLAIRVGSFDFKEDDVIYATGTNLPFYGKENDFDLLLSMCLDDDNREVFIDELLETYALDIYSGQMDRPNNIYYEFHPDGEVHVSRMFDYEQSFEGDLGDSYTSDFHIFRDISDYQEFMIKYPSLKDKLRSYLDVDLERIIKRVASSRRFDLSKIDMDKYKRYDEEAHKKLEKMLK